MPFDEPVMPDHVPTHDTPSVAETPAVAEAPAATKPDDEHRA